MPIGRSLWWPSLAVALALCACSVAVADTAIVSERPTPLSWQQWEPPKDDLDRRLAATVAVWEPEITVADLLRRLSEQTGVPLSTTADLGDCEATVYLRQHPLRGVMVGLTHAFGSYWAYRRGQAPGARTYCLVPSPAPPASVSAYLEGMGRASIRARAAADRPQLEKQLAQYRAALAMSPDELLAAYEKTAPWVCAHLLDPALRRMVEQIAALPPADLDGLVSTGRLARPLRSFEAAFGQHLGRWVKGAWGPTTYSQTAPDPDALPRFATPQEAWANSVVRLLCHEDSIQFGLELPTDEAFTAWVIGDGGLGPLPARMKLAELGYREVTGEYTQAAQEEEMKWQEAREGQRRAPAPRTPAPDLNDPRLQRALDLGALPKSQPLPAAAVLEEAARQCALNALSVYLPPDRCALPWPDESQEVTLGTLLSGIRSARHEAWSWGFLGRLLLGADADYWLIAHSPEPAEAIATWSKKLVPGAAVDLDELAAALADLDLGQVNRLCKAVPALQDLPAYQLHFYGLLTAEQRERMASNEGARAAELSPDQQQEAWLFARRTHPWLEREDLGQAVLRVLPRALSTGDRGFSLIVEYHFPDSPNDRDIFLTSPLSLHLPDRRGAEE